MKDNSAHATATELQLRQHNGNRRALKHCTGVCRGERPNVRRWEYCVGAVAEMTANKRTSVVVQEPDYRIDDDQNGDVADMRTIADMLTDRGGDGRHLGGRAKSTGLPVSRDPE